MIASHQGRDGAAGDEDQPALNEERVKRLHNEAARTREFLACHTERKSAKGAIRKSNVTDNDSAKMATVYFHRRLGQSGPFTQGTTCRHWR